MIHAVLDTNVCLNLWFFKDARTLSTLGALLSGQRMQVHGSPAMLTELLRVARSPHLAKYAVQADAFAQLEAAWRATVDCHVTQLTQPSPMRCRDADDQIFLDVAHTFHAEVLFSLDRDLLKLKKRAKSLGLIITDPKDY